VPFSDTRLSNTSQLDKTLIRVRGVPSVRLTEARRRSGCRSTDTHGRGSLAALTGAGADTTPD
jgi:hypothetical protein